MQPQKGMLESYGELGGGGREERRGSRRTGSRIDSDSAGVKQWLPCGPGRWPFSGEGARDCCAPDSTAAGPTLGGHMPVLMTSLFGAFLTSFQTVRMAKDDEHRGVLVVYKLPSTSERLSESAT